MFSSVLETVPGDRGFQKLDIQETAADTGSMDYVVAALLAGIFTLLIAVLRELGRIRTALSRSPWSRHPSDQEGRQTVTVNVGALPVGNPSPGKISETPAAPEPSPGPEPEPDSVPEPEPEPEPEPPPRPVPPRRQGGVSAVKCPHCGSENSSFRTECFQCGKRL